MVRESTVRCKPPCRWASEGPNRRISFFQDAGIISLRRPAYHNQRTDAFFRLPLPGPGLQPAPDASAGLVLLRSRPRVRRGRGCRCPGCLPLLPAHRAPRPPITHRSPRGARAVRVKTGTRHPSSLARPVPRMLPCRPSRCQSLTSPRPLSAVRALRHAETPHLCHRRLCLTCCTASGSAKPRANHRCLKPRL